MFTIKIRAAVSNSAISASVIFDLNLALELRIDSVFCGNTKKKKKLHYFLHQHTAPVRIVIVLPTKQYVFIKNLHANMQFIVKQRECHFNSMPFEAY